MTKSTKYNFRRRFPEHLSRAVSGLLSVLVVMTSMAYTAGAEGYVARYGSFTVNSEAELTSEELYLADGILHVVTDKPITVSNFSPAGSAYETIRIDGSRDADITLDGLRIAAIGGPAIYVPDGSFSDLRITLAEGTESILKGSTGYAGIEADGTDCSVTIGGNGSLTVQGGKEGAGIGAGAGFRPGSINIEGGNITATGGTFAAGIGGGDTPYELEDIYEYTYGVTDETVYIGNILISGGSVKAQGGKYGAGIGGGYNGSAIRIGITGGVIEATGGVDAAGIGGGRWGSVLNTSITGGTVTATSGGNGAAGIGKGRGSCVTALNCIIAPKASILAESISLPPKNAVYLDVYPLRIGNPSLLPITVDGEELPLVNHGHENAVYVYLTGENHSVTIGDVETVFFFDEERMAFADHVHVPADGYIGRCSATCAESGYTGDYLCSVCGETVIGATIPALGHNYQTTIYDFDEEHETGRVEYVCLNGCGEDYTTEGRIGLFGDILVMCEDADENLSGISFSEGNMTGVLRIDTDKRVYLTHVEGFTGYINETVVIGKDVNADIVLTDLKLSPVMANEAITIEDDSNGNVTISTYRGTKNELKDDIRKNGSAGSLTFAGEGELYIDAHNNAIGAADGNLCCPITVKSGYISIDSFWGAFGAGRGVVFPGDDSYVSFEGGAIRFVDSTSVNAEYLYCGNDATIYVEGYDGLELTNYEGTRLYSLEIGNPEEADVYVDGRKMLYNVFPYEDSLMVYLTPEEHTVKVGSRTAHYRFDEDSHRFYCDHNPEDHRTGVREVTCTEDGYTGDVLCEYCGEILERGIRIDAAGHDYEVISHEVENVRFVGKFGTIAVKCKTCGDEHEFETFFHSFADYIVELPVDMGRDEVTGVTFDSENNCYSFDCYLPGVGYGYIGIQNFYPDRPCSVGINIRSAKYVFLSGVNTAASQTAAMTIDGTYPATYVIMENEAANTLSGSDGYCGLSASYVTIGGDGSLSATGGIGAPGIGRSDYSLSNFHIVSGTVEAIGGAGAPGIGSTTSLYSTFITGGSVTAIGGTDAPGIGGNESFDTLYITNAVVTAIGTGSANGIGVGPNASEWGTSFSEVIITDDRCSVKAVPGNSLFEPIVCGVTNEGAESCSLYVVDNPLGEMVFVNGEDYGLTSHGDEMCLYLYLPEGTYAFNTANAAYFGPFIVIGDVLDSIRYDEATATLNIDTAEEVTVQNADRSVPADSRIVISADRADVTLGGVNIGTTSGEAIRITGLFPTVTLGEDSVNRVKNTGRNPAILWNPLTDNPDSSLTFLGSGELLAENTGLAAAIGYSEHRICGDLNILSGRITAISAERSAIGCDGTSKLSRIVLGSSDHTGLYLTADGGTNRPDIGGGYSSTDSNTSIVIAGGTVSACSDKYSLGRNGTHSIYSTGETLTIAPNATVKLAETIIPYKNADNDPVFLCTIENPEGDDLAVDGEPIPSSHFEEPRVYVYLTQGEHTLTRTKDGTSEDETLTVLPVCGDFAVSGGTYGVDYEYVDYALNVLSGTPLTVSMRDGVSRTSDIITTAPGVSADLTLDGIKIEAPIFCSAISLADGCDAHITLTGTASINYLSTYVGKAAIRKNGTGGTLTVDGSGTLYAVCHGGGACIGSDSGADTGNIEILGGGYILTTSNGAAAIGSGFGGNAENLTVSGGNIEIRASMTCAAGIGSGEGGDVENIRILGGVLTIPGNMLAGYGIGCGSKSVGSTSGIFVAPTASLKCDSFGCLPRAEDGSICVLTVIDNPDGAPITVNGVLLPFTSHNDEKRVYLYLHYGKNEILLGDELTVIDVPYYAGDFRVTGGIPGVDYVYDTEEHVLTIKGPGPFTITNIDPAKPTTDRIEVEKGTGVQASVTLAGININMHVTAGSGGNTSGTTGGRTPGGSGSQDGGTQITEEIARIRSLCPFDAEAGEGGSLRITLANGTANILNAGSAGIPAMKKEDGGSLTIGGTGKLELISGENTPALGSADNSTANITVNGGECVFRYLEVPYGNAAGQSVTQSFAYGIGGAHGLQNVEFSGGTILFNTTASIRQKAALGANDPESVGSVVIKNCRITSDGIFFNDPHVIGASSEPGSFTIYPTVSFYSSGNEVGVDLYSPSGTPVTRVEYENFDKNPVWVDGVLLPFRTHSDDWLTLYLYPGDAEVTVCAVGIDYTATQNGDVLTLDVTPTPFSDLCIGRVPIVAAYGQDGALLDVQIGETYTNEARVDSFTLNVQDAVEVKIMLVESLLTLSPLCPAEVWVKPTE